MIEWIRPSDHLPKESGAENRDIQCASECEGGLTMNKPIKDYTLGEAQELCKKTDINTCEEGKCPLNRWCTSVKHNDPEYWILTDQPSWTPEEVERAKMLKELIPEAARLERGATVVYVLGGFGGGYCCALGADRFPTIRIGEIVKLEEIINAMS